MSKALKPSNTKIKEKKSELLNELTQETESETSIALLPWHKSKEPPVYPNAQTGESTTFTECCLFYVADSLTITAILLILTSTWSLFFKPGMNPNVSVELAYFALPTAALCLLCSWLICSVHNDEKSYKLLFLVLIMLTFAIVLMVIAICIGYTHNLNLGQTIEEFRAKIEPSMKRSDMHLIWNKTLTNSRCCDVSKNTFGLPISCIDNSTSSTGCLPMIKATLAWQTRLFSGINCVALFLQCCAFLIVGVIYFRGKGYEEE